MILPRLSSRLEREPSGADIPEFRAVNDDLKGPLAGQLRDLSEQRTGEVGGADDEGFSRVHRLRSSENGSVTQTVGDSGRINGRLGEIALAAATAAAANPGLGQFIVRWSWGGLSVGKFHRHRWRTSNFTGITPFIAVLTVRVLPWATRYPVGVYTNTPTGYRPNLGSALECSPLWPTQVRDFTGCTAIRASHVGFHTWRHHTLT